MKPIIRVENLGKEYRIGLKAEPYTTLRESLVNAARRPIDALSGKGKKNGDDRFWALKDVNFEVMPGEVVGIIGRNGAGKSTLLKVLSRITEPTTGRIELYGRIGSLLEVGTGFHPELTGRENIYLNGAILGMKHDEISRKFDEIVDFAEIEEFLDTPVKRYSSGMYVRLAFAVAANLEPEVLIIDEVLAVGDTAFQRKCIGKMEDVSKNEGRTVIFVSHNIGVVSSLCTTGILLHKGEVGAIGPIREIVSKYFEIDKSDTDDKVRVDILNEEELWTTGKILQMRVAWDAGLFRDGCVCDLAFYTVEGTKIFGLESHKLMDNRVIPGGKTEAIFSIENIGLVDREVRVDVGLKRDIGSNYDVLVENACSLSIPSAGLYDYKVDDSIIVPKASVSV
ncbi:MAG: ABC transporter ATP-binding protein [Saprospiraceae bacterium]|nr:ABC transporter ATP-binding protein [Pyrinomonadaceae bacterium]